MANTYEQGQEVVLYATFLDNDGTSASVSGTPQIRINHVWSGVVNDVVWASMSSLTGVPSTYYYQHLIPMHADRTIYTVVYSGTYTSGENVLGVEDFYVAKRGYLSPRAGGTIRSVGGAKDVWTEKEKDYMIHIAEKISDALANGNNKELTELSVVVRESIGTIHKLSERNDSVAIGDAISELEKQLRKCIDSIHKNDSFMEKSISDVLTSIKTSGDAELNTINAKWSSLGRELAEIKTNLLNDSKSDRTALIVMQLEDIQKQINELSEAYVKTMSTEGLVKAIPTERMREMLR